MLCRVTWKTTVESSDNQTDNIIQKYFATSVRSVYKIYMKFLRSEYEIICKIITVHTDKNIFTRYFFRDGN